MRSTALIVGRVWLIAWLAGLKVGEGRAAVGETHLAAAARVPGGAVVEAMMAGKHNRYRDTIRGVSEENTLVVSRVP